MLPRDVVEVVHGGISTWDRPDTVKIQNSYLTDQWSDIDSPLGNEIVLISVQRQLMRLGVRNRYQRLRPPAPAAPDLDLQRPRIRGAGEPARRSVRASGRTRRGRDCRITLEAVSNPRGPAKAGCHLRFGSQSQGNRNPRLDDRRVTPARPDRQNPCARGREHGIRRPSIRRERDDVPEGHRVDSASPSARVPRRRAVR